MSPKYDDYTREELISLLKQRDRKPRFGLIWERDEIEHDRSLNNDFVTLELVPSFSIGIEPYSNLLIEGDNFDALRYLRMTHTGRVKCIYIDPPFNTGNKDFIYNDRFVDKDDTYKHSKWLEYMYQRLTLARDLLAEDGVIFVSIGDDELGNLSVLMGQVFVGMKVGVFVWRRRSGSNDAKEWFLSVDHEYILCYANPGFSFSGEAKDKSAYTNPDGDPRGPWDNGPLNQGKTAKQRKESYYPIMNPRSGVWYPCDPDSVWRFASETRLKPSQKIRTKTMEQLIREEKVIWPQNDTTVQYNSIQELRAAIDAGTAPHNLRHDTPDLEFWVDKLIGYGKPRYKRHWSELKRSEKPLSTWILPASTKKEDKSILELDDVEIITSGFTVEGTSLLHKMVGNKDFPYPKPLSLISGLIKQSTGPDDMVLDFFAGSGTTGHAVLALNEEDGGNRRFILVTSTEATKESPSKNVCRDITRIRLGSAINGYSYNSSDGQKTVDGLGGDFAYLRITRIPIDQVNWNLKNEQVWLALQMIYRDTTSPYQPEKPLQSTGDEPTLVYVPSVNRETVHSLTDLARKKIEVVAYSWQPGVLRQHIYEANITFEQIPKALLDLFGVSA
ncbi:MAG: site-specific DNA-methyltransferase [Acidobacteria bacterium]|nr:site-specific DNA-methyltransferase [Acidobacteriota bacterium]